MPFFFEGPFLILAGAAAAFPLCEAVLAGRLSFAGSGMSVLMTRGTGSATCVLMFRLAREKCNELRKDPHQACILVVDGA